MVVGVVSVVNTGGDLTSADDFLQGDQHQLDGQERHAFIEEIQGAVKDEVPAKDDEGGDGKYRMCLKGAACRIWFYWQRWKDDVHEYVFR